MKILFTNDSPLIKYGLAAGFQQIGHQVKIMREKTEQLWTVPPREQKIRLRRAMANFRPDFLFTEGHPRFEPEIICGTAQQMGIPHLYWAIEDPVCTALTLNTYAPKVEYIFTTTVECIAKYRGLGKKSELLLFGCNPDFHRFTGVIPEYRHDLVLVASNYSSRYQEAQWFIMPLVESGYDIKIWGLWWNDPSRPVNLTKYAAVYGGLLPYEYLPAVYSSAKIILGINCDDSSKTQTSMRPYEALACGGGLYLGHYTKAQEYLFKDLIFQTYNTTGTLAAVNRILKMPSAKLTEHARRARRKMYELHTYGMRALQIVRAFQSI